MIGVGGEKEITLGVKAEFAEEFDISVPPFYIPFSRDTAGP